MNTRSLIQAAVVAAVAAVPAASFAQQQAPLTRAQVRAELQQLEQAGYDPSRADEVSYPADIQAAEARVHQQNAVAAGQVPAGNTGYGSPATGATQSGPAPQTDMPQTNMHQ